MLLHDSVILSAWKTLASKRALLISAIFFGSLVSPGSNLVWPQGKSGSLSVGIVSGVHVEGCGCYFKFPLESGDSERYVFFEDFSEKSPVMNIDGRNIRLKLISSTEPNRSKRKGERFNRTYGAGNLRVRINFVVTSVCAPNDEQCESDSYNATIIVTRRNQKRTIKVVGGCGC